MQILGLVRAGCFHSHSGFSSGVGIIHVIIVATTLELRTQTMAIIIGIVVLMEDNRN